MAENISLYGKNKKAEPCPKKKFDIMMCVCGVKSGVLYMLGKPSPTELLIPAS